MVGTKRSAVKRLNFQQKNDRKMNNDLGKVATYNNNAQPSFVVGDGCDVSVDEELDYEFPKEEEMGTEQPLPAAERGVVDPPVPNMEGHNEDEEDSEIMLGGTGETLNQEKLIMENPSLRKLFNQLLDERIKQATEKGESSGYMLLTAISPQQQGKQSMGMVARGNLVKSPSDTMVYAPALKQRTNPVNW